MTKSVADKTSAAKKLIGFDFQYYYALLLFIKLKPEDEVGIEVKDDIHILDQDGKLFLFQLKHSLQKNANDKTINLTERDYDLWHTISNWIDLIQDPVEGRNIRQEQLKFITNTTFVLVSNKSSRGTNNFIQKLSEIQEGKLSKLDFVKYLEELSSDTENVVIKSYIDKLILQGAGVLEEFLKKIEFRLDEDNLHEKIIKAISDYHLLDEVDAEEVFIEVNGRFQAQNYLVIKNGFSQCYSKRKFNKEILSPALNKLRSQSLVVTELLNFTPTGNLDNEIFAKQLTDIEVPQEEIEDKELFRQLCLQNLKKWSERKMIITSTERENFFNDARRKWLNKHRPKHRKCETLSDEDNLFNAKDCYDECMSIDLYLKGTQVDSRISNGTFCELSNVPEIGWTHNWESKYKKSKP